MRDIDGFVVDIIAVKNLVHISPPRCLRFRFRIA
jgi:hypothetical protein